VHDLLDRIRADDPREPLWSGVRDVETQPGGVRVEFRDDCVDPPLYPVDGGRHGGGQDVACLLYRDDPTGGAPG
jgi:hypothetical protein